MLSVAIATLDRPEHIRRAIASLMDDSDPPLDLLIVDQSDGPETRAVVEAAGRPGLRYIHHTPKGLSGARNRGAREARGEYVAFLDDDCEVPRGWTRTLLAELEAFGRPDGLWGEIRAPAGTEERRRDVPPVSTFTVPRARTWDMHTHPNRLGYGGHMVVRRSTFLTLGGFDERFGPGGDFPGAEDMDFNYRLLKSGAQVATTPRLSVIHHQWRSPDDLPRLFHGYNHAHSAFVAKHLRMGDRRALTLFLGQVRDDAKMFASSARRRSMLVARIAARRVVGTWGGLVDGWRGFGDRT
ncbi:MAG: glycosyltransferase family 2 protein [Solirubrobacteraceae bacterium]